MIIDGESSDCRLRVLICCFPCIAVRGYEAVLLTEYQQFEKLSKSITAKSRKKTILEKFLKIRQGLTWWFDNFLVWFGSENFSCQKNYHIRTLLINKKQKLNNNVLKHPKLNSRYLHYSKIKVSRQVFCGYVLI